MIEQEGEPGLKREIIEARNQAIKTDNQVKNLCLDVRSFEKRFDALEQRTRLASVAVNVIVALTLAGSAYAVTHVMARTYDGEIAALKRSSELSVTQANGQVAALEQRLAKMEGRRHARQAAGAVATKMLALLDARQEQQAGELLDTLDEGELSSLERTLLQQRLADLRRRQAIASYRQGRQALVDNDQQKAIAALGRSLKLDAKGSYARASREYLAWALWRSKAYAEAEPLLREWLNAEPDEPTGTARYLLATSLVHQNKRDAARAAFLQVAGKGDRSRFAKAAQAYLAALATEAELPTDLPDGRVRPAKVAAAPAEAAAAEAPAPALAHEEVAP